VNAVTLREDLSALVAATKAGDLPALVGELAAAQATALARLTTPAPVHGNETADAERNLDAAEAARRLGVSKGYLYRHAKRLPFAVRIGRRIVFSAQGLTRWSRQQRSGA
jgi:excisionase family DNA binding protein